MKIFIMVGRKVESMRKSYAFLFICTVFALNVFALCHAEDLPFTLTIRANKPVEFAGSQIFVWVIQTNISTHVVDCTAAHMDSTDVSYHYDAWDENAKPVNKIDYGIPYVSGVHSSSHGDICNLEPGKSFEKELIVSFLYDFSKPGKYSIQLSRRALVDSNGYRVGEWVKSNTITITVLPAKAETPNQPFTLTISYNQQNPDLESISDQVVKAGSWVGFRIRKTNISDHEIIKISDAAGASGYMYDVRDSSGNLVNYKKHNNLIDGMMMTSGGEVRIGGTKDMVLQPLESNINFEPLDSWHEIDKPGTYTIQVSEHVSNDPKSDVVKSNTITVLPAEAKPVAEIEPAEEKNSSEDELSEQTTKQPFSIKINADPTQVKVGNPVYVGIELSNTSDHEIDCSAMTGNNGIDLNFQYEVIYEHGNPEREIAAGKTYPEAIPCTLKPENNYSTGSEISRVFDFSRLGRYTIQLSRPVWGNDQIPGTGRTVQNGQAVVKSNKITITVLPADAP